MTIDEEAFSVMTNRAVRRGYMRLDDLRDFVEAYEQAKKPCDGGYYGVSWETFGMGGSTPIGNLMEALEFYNEKIAKGMKASIYPIRQAKNMGGWHSADSSLEGTAKSLPCESEPPATALSGAKHCLHYNMAPNYRCNDCGYVLSKEEREDYPYGNDE